MIKNKFSLVAGALLAGSFALSTAAYADDEDVPEAVSHKSEGVYFSGGVGYGIVSPDVGGGLGIGRHTGVVFGPALGYQFDVNAAVELGYIKLPKVTINGVESMKDAYDITLLVRGTIPLGETWALFSKFGIGYLSYKSGSQAYTINGNTIDANSTHHNVVPVVGGGIMYHINQSLSLGIQEIVTFNTGNAPMTYATIFGMTHIF
jgi:hypothetical protein